MIMYHIVILYELFTKEKVPKHIFTSLFYEKIQFIKECDTITFYKSKKSSKEIIFAFLTLHITPMIYCRLVVNVYSQKFL